MLIKPPAPEPKKTNEFSIGFFLMTLIGFILGLFLSLILTNSVKAQTDSVWIDIKNLDKEETILSTNIIAQETYGDVVALQYWDDIAVVEDGFVIFDGNTISNGIVKRKYLGLQFKQDELSNEWFNIGYATTTLTEFNKISEVEKLGILDKFVTSANAETIYSGSGDGRSYATDATWATAHGAANGTASDYTSANIGLGSNLSTNYYIRRGFFPFDFSSETDCITEASFFVTPASTQGSTDVNVHITKGSLITNTEVVDGDYDGIVFDSLAYVSTADMAVNTPEEFVITELSYIATGSWTVIALTDNYDYANSAPLTNSKFFNYYMSENTGTAYDPYVEYTVTTCGEEETPTGTTTTGVLPILNDIAIITGYTEHYTDSTTTPSEIEYHYYHIPFFAWLVFYGIFVFIFGRLIIELIIILRK